MGNNITLSSSYMTAAIKILVYYLAEVVQLQSDNTYCAWGEPTGVNNLPRWQSGSRSVLYDDNKKITQVKLTIIDTEYSFSTTLAGLTYGSMDTSAGTAYYITGSANPLNKATHNGQNCGVTDYQPGGKTVTTAFNQQQGFYTSSSDNSQLIFVDQGLYLAGVVDLYSSKYVHDFFTLKQSARLLDCTGPTTGRLLYKISTNNLEVSSLTDTDIGDFYEKNSDIVFSLGNCYSQSSTTNDCSIVVEFSKYIPYYPVDDNSCFFLNNDFIGVMPSSNAETSTFSSVNPRFVCKSYNNSPTTYTFSGTDVLCFHTKTSGVFYSFFYSSNGPQYRCAYGIPLTYYFDIFQQTPPFGFIVNLTGHACAYPN